MPAKYAKLIDMFGALLPNHMGKFSYLPQSLRQQAELSIEGSIQAALSVRAPSFQQTVLLI